MTTIFYLLRHAAHDNVGGYLAGRKPGVMLGQAGLAQAERLGVRMLREPIVAVHTSPRERAHQTAAAVAAACAIERVIEDPELDEVDFGEAWQGRDFKSLDGDAAWRRWNEKRDLARTAGGERMIDVQSRALSLIERLGLQHPDAALALVSHAEVIKSVVCQVLGLPASTGERFDIEPASVTAVTWGDWGAKLLLLNESVG